MEVGVIDGVMVELGGKERRIEIPFPCVPIDEIGINFVSSGYYEPAIVNGPAERCHPEEGVDAREVVSVVFYCDGEEIGLTKHAYDLSLIEELFSDEIAAAELEDSE